MTLPAGRTSSVSRPGRPHRLLLAASAATVAVVALVGLLRVRQPLGAFAWSLLEWARGSGAAGWTTTALVQMLVACTGILPASVTGIATGAIYGVVWGFLLASIGTLAGAIIAFLLARSLGRPLVLRWLGRRTPARRQWMARLDTAIARDGWRTVCLLRLSPVMPFAATSYTLGLTGVTTRDFMLGTLASLPALLGYVVLGCLAGVGVQAANSGAGIARWSLLGVGIVATLVLTLRIGRLARASDAAPDEPSEVSTGGAPSGGATSSTERARAGAGAPMPR
ncbi:TVP38/TMEM64 family protein [Lichenicola sp.]|uniref:TVP38/TMEM64 family protein n=1 Tax=Lichenicola sp. TaxID=2804529 RepID=UPI003AFFF1EB